MKKKGLFITCLLSFIFIFSLVGFAFGRNKAQASNLDPTELVSAFQDLQVIGGNCKLECIGRWQDGIYSSLEKQKLLELLAEKLGITDGYTLNVSSNEIKDRVDLSKHGKNANTMISIVTDNAHEINYVLIKIAFMELTDSSVYYKTQLQKLLKENRIDGNVTLEMKGYYEGELSKEQKDHLADYFFKKVDGRMIKNDNLDDLYTIYGYTRVISEYLMINENRINLNLAFNYDESKDQTNVYAATPVLKEDY